MAKLRKRPRCSAADCTAQAWYEVFLYDVYYDDLERYARSPGGDPNERIWLPFMEQDYTCPYLCEEHLIENEMGCRISEDFKEEDVAPLRDEHGFISVGDLLALPDPPRLPAGRGRTYGEVHEYPYTNRHHAKGFSVYRSLKEWVER
jgi:hypothetical protein